MDKIRKVIILLIVCISLVIGGCTRAIATNQPTPEGTDVLDFLLNSATPTNDYTRRTNTPTPADTEESAADAGDEGDGEQATEAPEAGEVQEATEAEVPPTEVPPTATLHIITPTPEIAEPTATLTPVVLGPPDLNPDLVFKGAHYVDSFDDPQPWYDMSGMLPDSQYINIEVLEGDMLVTGKLEEWDTWWLSGYTMYDYYIEMEVDSGECAENDAYGLMVRASQHDEPTRGYIVGLTCDGKVFAKRLTSVTPYVAISILNPTESEFIKSGPNQTNTLGVWAEDNELEIYINRYYFTIIYDNTFEWGRYGIFVKAGEGGNYTYTAHELRVWGVVSED
jgi:hypothetical protein